MAPTAESEDEKGSAQAMAFAVAVSPAAGPALAAESEQEMLQCRFCLGDEPPGAVDCGVVIQPCTCKAYVHPKCLKRWQQQQAMTT